MDSLEKNLEKRLLTLVNDLGGLTLKLTFIKGIPDRLVLLPESRVYFFELKTKKGRLTNIQKWWLNKLTKLGFIAECVNSYSQICKILKIEEGL